MVVLLFQPVADGGSPCTQQFPVEGFGVLTAAVDVCRSPQFKLDEKYERTESEPEVELNVDSP